MDFFFLKKESFFFQTLPSSLSLSLLSKAHFRFLLQFLFHSNTDVISSKVRTDREEEEREKGEGEGSVGWDSFFHERKSGMNFFSWKLEREGTKFLMENDSTGGQEGGQILIGGKEGSVSKMMIIELEMMIWESFRIYSFWISSFSLFLSLPSFLVLCL